MVIDINGRCGECRCCKESYNLGKKEILLEVVQEAEQWDRQRLIEVINKKLWELDK